jgi:peptidoglycan/xylan/chitin deacetylase (PgdA/CDA1 family)
MSVKSAVKRILPQWVRRVGWRGYYHARAHRLQTMAGCQTSRKIAALTFDDGPDPAGTLPIIEMLARYRVSATFFVLGKNVTAYPEIVRRVVHAGHAIGHHTFTPPRLVGCHPRTVARELILCQKSISCPPT